MSYNYSAAQLADIKDLILHVTMSRLAVDGLTATVTITGGAEGSDNVRSFGMTLKFVQEPSYKDFFIKRLQYDLSTQFNAIIFVDAESNDTEK